MSNTPKKLVVDVSAGTSQYIDLTPQEIAQRDQDAASASEQQAIRETEAEAQKVLKESARAKLVAGEALTAEEAAILIV